jgi:hypothetical protein
MLAEEMLEKYSRSKADDIPAEDREKISIIYSQIKDLVHGIQMGFRNLALMQTAGIPGENLPPMRVPYRLHPDLELALPLDDSTTEKLGVFYDNKENPTETDSGPKENRIERPTIMTYGELVGAGPLEDQLTGGMLVADEQVEYFMDTRKKALHNIFQMLSP